MEFAQRRILHDQNRRWQQDERWRVEKVSPRPFRVRLLVQHAFRAVCTAAECAGVAHACARVQGKARNGSGRYRSTGSVRNRSRRLIPRCSN